MRIDKLALISFFLFAILVAAPAFAETAAPTPRSADAPNAVFNKKYNPVPDQETEITLDVGLIMGGHIGADMSEGFRGGFTGIFPIATDLGVYGHLGASISSLNSHMGIGVSLGAGMYGLEGMDVGVLVDYFHPDEGISLYQTRVFIQSAFTPVDRLGMRAAFAMGKDRYDWGPSLVPWNFELASYVGIFWQHSWYDEFASEIGLYYVGGDVNSGMVSANLLYYYNENVNFRFSAMSDFNGNEFDIGFFVEIKFGPGAKRKTSFDKMRFFSAATASHQNAILNYSLP